METALGPETWLTRLIGRKLPGDDNDKYAPGGWTFAELGPDNMKTKGEVEMENDQVRLLKQTGRGGCPFTLP